MQTTNEKIVFLVLSTSIIILILLLLSITILFVYQNKQKIHQDKINALKTDFDKSLLKTQIEIQEQTLQNISTEIHDNIGLSLSLAKLQLNTLRLLDQETEQEMINNSVTLISDAIADLRSLSKGLNSEMIRKTGLIGALEEETERIKRTGKFSVQLAITGNVAFLETERELLLFRVVQESLNNIIKHSEATEAVIRLNYENSALLLEIRDNGQGFRPELNQKNGSGLSNIESRTRMMNGHFQIDSSPSGTAVKINIPI